MKCVLGVMFVFVEWLNGGCYVDVDIDWFVVVCYGLLVVDI